MTGALPTTRVGLDQPTFSNAVWNVLCASSLRRPSASMKERTVPSGSNSYDLTGVGGDTAGCLLAARPSASTERVSCCWRQVERGRRALLPHFQRSENTRGRVPAFRGVGGALTFRPAWPNPVLAACLAAAGETGHPLVGEVSRGIEEGFGWTDLNILDGKRQISADAYLAPAAAPAGPELLRRRPRPRHDGRRSAAGASDRAGVRSTCGGAQSESRTRCRPRGPAPAELRQPVEGHAE